MKNNLLVPSFNEVSSLKELLDVVLKNDFFDKIVIVDGNSTDGTSNLIRDYNNVKLLFISSDDFSLKNSISPIAKSRNLAISIFDKDSIIFFIDLGCKYDEKSIFNLIGAFSNPNVDYSYGVTFPFTSNKYSKIYSSLFIKKPHKYNSFHLPSSRFLGMRYRVFEEIGGYREKAFAGEDTDFANKLVKKYRGVLIDGHIYWNVPNSRSKAIKKHFFYGLGDGKYRNNLFTIFFCLFGFFLPTQFSDFSLYFYEKMIVRFSYGIGGFFGLIDLK